MGLLDCIEQCWGLSGTHSIWHSCSKPWLAVHHLHNSPFFLMEAWNQLAIDSTFIFKKI